MALTQIINIKQPELAERIASFTDLNTAIQGAFRCVFTKHNNEWSMAIGVLTLSNADLYNAHQAHWLKYPNHQFICEHIQDVTISELVLRLENDRSLPIADLPKLGLKENDLNWTESLIPSHVNGPFPIKRYSARMCSNISFHESKLVAHGMPFHSSASDYVREFLGLDRFSGSSDGRKCELHIDIPDQRGRLVLSNKDVRFHCGTTDTLSVVGAIDGDPVNLSRLQDTYSFEPEKVSDMELWLVTDSDEIIDYRSSSEWEYRYDTRMNSCDQTKLLQIIAAGESEHCEFKPYIDLNKPNKKAWDLDKTVCAFSNHQGGKLFIGVDDDTSIIGINDSCKRDYQCSPSEGAECYQKEVAKRLQESLNKNQCFTTYLIEHSNLFVLVVDVHKSNDLNYLLGKNEAYIRRGASSRQMTPSEIQAFRTEQYPFEREIFDR